MKAILLGAVVALALSACGEQSVEAKRAENMKGIHALTGEERNRAEINARQFYNKARVEAGGQVGQFNECKPSDSNANGLVSCYGMVPQQGGGFKEVVRYCGYTPELVGCSPEDTVGK